MSDVYELIDYGNRTDENCLVVDFNFGSEVSKEEAIETISLMSKLLTAHKVGTKDYIFSVSSDAKRNAKEFTYKPTMFAVSQFKEVNDE